MSNNLDQFSVYIFFLSSQSFMIRPNEVDLHKFKFCLTSFGTGKSSNENIHNREAKYHFSTI